MPPTSIMAPHSGRYLSFAEREEISICRAYGFGIREIARHLGRSASTISREVRLNAATRGAASAEVVYGFAADQRRGVADGNGHRVILRVLRFSREETRWPRQTV
jgi:IS30 family transposase